MDYRRHVAFYTVDAGILKVKGADDKSASRSGLESVQQMLGVVGSLTGAIGSLAQLAKRYKLDSSIKRLMKDRHSGKSLAELADKFSEATGAAVSEEIPLLDYRAFICTAILAAFTLALVVLVVVWFTRRVEARVMRVAIARLDMRLQSNPLKSS